MTAQLAKLALDLRAVREGQVRPARAEQVEALDLLVEHRLGARIEALDEVIDRLDAVGSAVVDGLEAPVTHEQLPLAAEVPLGRSLRRRTIAAGLSAGALTGIPPWVKPALERGQLDPEPRRALLGLAADNGAETCQLALRRVPVAEVPLKVSAGALDVRAHVRPFTAAPRRDAVESFTETRLAALGVPCALLGPRHRRSQLGDTHQLAGRARPPPHVRSGAPRAAPRPGRSASRASRRRESRPHRVHRRPPLRRIDQVERERLGLRARPGAGEGLLDVLRLVVGDEHL